MNLQDVEVQTLVEQNIYINHLPLFDFYKQEKKRKKNGRFKKYNINRHNITIKNWRETYVPYLKSRITEEDTFERI